MKSRAGIQSPRKQDAPEPAELRTKFGFVIGCNQRKTCARQSIFSRQIPEPVWHDANREAHNVTESARYSPSMHRNAATGRSRRARRVSPVRAPVPAPG